MADTKRQKRDKRLQLLEERLLEKLALQLEQEQPDYSAVKQICATLKDVEGLRQQSQGGDSRIAVELTPELEILSR